MERRVFRARSDPPDFILCWKTRLKLKGNDKADAKKQCACSALCWTSSSEVTWQTGDEELDGQGSGRPLGFYCTLPKSDTAKFYCKQSVKQLLWSKKSGC